MRILHLSSARSWRGGEQQIAYLFQTIRTLDPDSEQWIACPRDSAMSQWCFQNNWAHFTYVKKSSLSPFVAVRIKRFCLENKVDILHLHDSHAHSFGVISWLLGNRVPMVLSRRVDFRPGNSVFSRYKYAYKGIRRILCVSDAIMLVMKEYMPGDSRICTVHSGIDLSKYGGPVQGDLRRELGLPGDSTLVINVAALARHKDPETFVRVASATLKENYPGLFFVWVGGDDGEQEKTEKLIEELKLQERVKLTGFRRDIPDLLAQADVFLFTSTKEGLGTSVLDAMATGLPIVATRTGGISEMIVDGTSGLMALPGDTESLSAQLCRILDDPDLVAQLSKGARECVRSFSKERTAEKTLGYYRDIQAEADVQRN